MDRVGRALNYCRLLLLNKVLDLTEAERPFFYIVNERKGMNGKLADKVTGTGLHLHCIYGRQ